MALIDCPECAATVSSLAKACPRCGCPGSVFNGKNEEEGGANVATGAEGGGEHLPEPEEGRGSGALSISPHWSEAGSEEEVERIKRGAVEGGFRGGKWYFSTLETPPRAPGDGVVKIDRSEYPELYRGILRGIVPAEWARNPEFTPPGWWIPTSLYLRYSHPTLGKESLVRPPHTHSLFAALLPWLWHIVHWTPKGIAWFLSALGAQSFLSLLLSQAVGHYDDEWEDYSEEAQMLILLRWLVFLVVAVVYFQRARAWHVASLEERGFEITGAVEAQTRDEARAKLGKASSTPPRA